MELLCPSAKRRRSEDLAASESPPRATEATEAANLGPTTHSKEPPPPDAGGGGGGGDVERISGLPDAVLGEIVSLLSTKEAGRTQTLASRWRHVWLGTPLVLDGTDLYTMALPGDRKTFTAANEALASAVSFILSAHPGPVRRFCIPSLYLQDRPATVAAWLSFPALDNLQELEFWEGNDMMWYIAPYPLAPPPASTFRFSATLRVAIFGKCELLDSSVEGIHFPHLKHLGLEDVSISEGSLHTMISSCPVLECLLLDGSFGVGCLRGLNVVSLTTALSNVKTLAVASWRINLDTVIELLKCFPCLEKLYIKSCISGEMNRWRRKHRDFIKSFDIRLKTVVLKQYRGIRSQVNFATFFVLNARELESMRLGVGDTDYNEAFFAEQYGVLQMEKRAS